MSSFWDFIRDIAESLITMMPVQ